MFSLQTVCSLSRIMRPKSGIYVVNHSTLVTDVDVAEWTAACATQISRDVAPAYGRKPVRVQFLPSAQHAPAGAWVLTVLNDPDQADALGYHSRDRWGRVFGRVFVQPCLDYGVPPSMTLSHEVVETFCDPGVDRWEASGKGYSVPFEACDPVQGDSYSIGGVAVSDFVYPAWYRAAEKNVAIMRNHLGTIREPFALQPGGYVVRRWSDGHEDQEFGPEANRGYIRAKRSPLSRTVRREQAAAA